jgi:hypothetical protein
MKSSPSSAKVGWARSIAYPGFVLWPRGQTLVAQRFDAGRLRLDGDPSPVADNVALDQFGAGLALFSAAGRGTSPRTASASS